MSVRSVAALYDIHCNDMALRAVLAEPDVQGADLVVLGGDVVGGPFPDQTFALLDSLGDRALWIRGNGERETGAADGRADAFVAERIGHDRCAWLAALPLTTTVDIVGLGPTLFCHATPRADDEVVTAATPASAIAEILAGVSQRTVVCGHVHVAFDRRFEAIRLVNPGSVGMPYESRPGAYWALLGPDVVHRRTEYDVATMASRVRASGYPLEELAGWITDPPAPDEVTAHFEGLRGDAPG